MKEYDVLVVGAGVIGLSTTYHIKRKHPELHVLVIDKFSAAGREALLKACLPSVVCFLLR